MPNSMQSESLPVGGELDAAPTSPAAPDVQLDAQLAVADPQPAVLDAQPVEPVEPTAPVEPDEPVEPTDSVEPDLTGAQPAVAEAQFAVPAVPPAQPAPVNASEARADVDQQVAQVPTRRSLSSTSGLTLTRAQMLEVHEMFHNANCVTRVEKMQILNFMAGMRNNPCPFLGDIATIKLSERRESVIQPDNTYLPMMAEVFFQMNFSTGQYTRLKKYRPLPGAVPQTIPPGSVTMTNQNGH